VAERGEFREVIPRSYRLEVGPIKWKKNRKKIKKGEKRKKRAKRKKEVKEENEKGEEKRNYILFSQPLTALSMFAASCLNLLEMCWAMGMSL
jgi:hypothetical protein